VAQVVLPRLCTGSNYPEVRWIPRRQTRPHVRGFTQYESGYSQWLESGYNKRMFEALENTALAIWVGESLWGYPIMLGLHAVGLAIVVGIFLMLDLRILGFNKGIAYASFLDLFKLAWIGLTINAVSGTALFTSQASVFVESAPFLIKISCVALGVVFGVLIRRELLVIAGDGNEAAVASAGKIRLLAVASLLCWIGAIFAGRLIAYM